MRESLQAHIRQHGWLLGLDGRRVPVRALYTALNYSVTSSEAIICKRWLVRVYDELCARFRYGWDGDVVIPLWVHDEIACCCRPEIAERVGEILVRHASEPGEFYHFKVPLEADYKIGASWAGEPPGETILAPMPIETAAPPLVDAPELPEPSAAAPVEFVIAASEPEPVAAAPAPPPAFEQLRAAYEQATPGRPNGKGNGHAEYDAAGAFTGASDGPTGNGHGERDTGQQVAFYVYRHADGRNYLGVKKTSTKQFPQYHWTGSAWVSGAPAGLKIPYRLPELIKAPPDAWVLICAGEKDADSAAALGLVATTNPEGERKGAWRAELNAWFIGRQRVAIMEDNDPTGQAHALEVANALRGVVPNIRIVTFRELPEHGDLTDWIKQGHNGAELLARIEAAKIERPTLKTWDVGELLGTGLPPPRRWLYGRQLCRRFLSSLVAPGDAGKTTLRLTQAIELAAGRELLGHRIYQRCRVLIVSLEDDHDELWRRLLAACRHHGIDRSELAGHLFCSTVNGPKLVERVNGAIQLGMLDGMLRESIEECRPDLLGLDPFVKLHALVENDNADMDFLCAHLTRLAHDYDMAVDSPAHTHKGALEAGNADNRRGASAQRDASRLDYTLARTSETEAERFGINPDERRDYVRLDRAKANIVRGSIKSIWLRMVNVHLGNATEEYPEGDEVQAIESWVPPETWAGITEEIISAVLDTLDGGMSDGQRYSSDGHAKARAAWQVVKRHCPDRNEAQCREIIKTWLKSVVLYNDDYDDPIDRKPRKGLFVNAAARARASESLTR